ncbi:MAG: aminotransferase class I/II-fold pyridoxal phosphate-dependent enzyme [Verrucomicrobiae bacterium]|nr:aminotransferase class I/II-fold pyridoxal phosphate-dependent enzyme [Verrucomicrobiae bacterium]
MKSIETISVHAGARIGTAGVVNALELSSAFRYIDEDSQPYPRYFNTPNQDIIVEKICALESAPDGLIFASGMAAITTTLLSLLHRGDHIVFQNALYGGTHSLASIEFEKAGISYTFSPCDARSLIEAIQPNTKAVYIETPSNPLLDTVDLESVAKITGPQRILTIVDNTFATPINQNPVKLGVDVVIHSGTKYLGGHSDLCFGAVVSSAAIVERIRQKAVLFGGSINALSCHTIERSIKTLAIRVQRQSENAIQIAESLDRHPKIERVFYPGLSSHPGHEIARQQMSGFGGMLSFRLASGISPKSFLKRLELIVPAMSLGGVESTATIPAYTSHKAMPESHRVKLGITERLVRLSVGIESSSDLVDDLVRALGD